jgi:hypothetical protein
MTAFRAGNGKFVSKTNPIAVIGRLNRLRAELRQAEALAMRERRETAHRLVFSTSTDTRKGPRAEQAITSIRRDG